METNPLLSKDIRFMFEPNSADLDMQNQANMTNLESIKKLIQVSPGSTILLRGHVDNALVDEFRKTRRRRLRAAAGAPRDRIEPAAAPRKSSGCWSRNTTSPPIASTSSAAAGKNRPASDSDKNRRVEVQWFTIE